MHLIFLFMKSRFEKLFHSFAISTESCFGSWDFKDSYVSGGTMTLCGDVQANRNQQKPRIYCERDYDWPERGIYRLMCQSHQMQANPRSPSSGELSL